MKLTRLSITNLLGIAKLEVNIHEDGAIATGGNGEGKSSFIKAVRAAFEAVGVDPSAIRIGADKSEILVDTDAAFRVRRAITHKGDTLTVTAANGDRWARPQTRLTELVGSTLDPLEFYLAKPEDRRKQVLAAMPVFVTPEDLKAWTGDDWEVTEGKHGLEVIADVRQHYYTQRTDANRDAKTAEIAHKAAKDEAARLATPDLAGVDVPAAGEEDAPVHAAERALEELAQRQQRAEEMARRTQGVRERIAKLRASANECAGRAPAEIAEDESRKLSAAWMEAKREVSRLEESLRAARKRYDEAEAALQNATAQNARRRAAFEEADRLRLQAADLEATLASTSIAPPTTEELAAARTAFDEAKRCAELVGRARAAHEATVKVAALADELTKAKKRAADLDTIVQRLTTEAPAEVAKHSQGIAGLGFSAEGGITLDGKAIDNLSGAEQLRFAVDLAKRASKAKILVVDGLERLDKTRLREFVACATAGGFQLLATLVTDGPLHIVEPSRLTIIGPDQPAEVQS